MLLYTDMSTAKITIGTRGSRLALMQANLVAQALKSQNPKLNISIKIIVTKGDKDHSPIPLDSVGKAWFTKEIEDALMQGEIDLAIHSLKDLPPEPPEDLRTTVVLERDDPRDVLVSKVASSLASLPINAVVGTDSIRRKAQLLYHRPDLRVKSIRGNVDSRLEKLETEDYDAIVLAAAGLTRLGLTQHITQYFTPGEFVPASGQAVLAAEIRQDDVEIWELLSGIQDSDTVLACQAEQVFARIIGGGCKLPVGCYAQIQGDKVTVYGMVGSMDAKHTVMKSVQGSKSDGVKITTKLAKELLGESVRQDW